MATSYENWLGQGDRTSFITVTTTATLGAGSASQMVNGTTSNQWWWNNGQSSRELKFDFGYARVIDEAVWTQSTSASHGTWKWQGSNDNSSWTDIGSTFTLGGALSQTHTQLNGNTTAYRYYRLTQTAGTTNSGPFLQELTFKIDTGAVAGSQSYGNPGGYGKRCAQVALTTTASTGSGTNNFPEALLDGTHGDTYFVASSQSGKEYKFDFRNQRLVTEAVWEQSTSDTHGTWKWQGSNDNSNWTDIGSSFTLGGALTQVFTQLNGNSTPYQYYKLLSTSGTMSTTPWLREVGFKIDDEVSITKKYSDARGSGDRSALITVTTTATISAGSIDKLVDGNVIGNSSEAAAFTAGESSKSITFDLGEAKVIDDAIWYQGGNVLSPAASHGTWKWQGSNDNSSYSDIGSTFTLGGARQSVHTSLNGNTSAYRYYRLTQTAGTTSTSPWLIEIGFRVGPGIITGDLSATLGAVTKSSDASVLVLGDLAKTLGAITISAAGTEPIVADLAQTLGAITDGSTLTVEGIADLSATLAALGLTSEVSVQVKGDVVVTLGPVLLPAADAQVIVAGGLSNTLGSLVCLSDFTIETVLNAENALGDVVPTADGTVLIQADLVVQLGSLRLLMRSRRVHPGAGVEFEVPCGLPPRCTTVKSAYRRA